MFFNKEMIMRIKTKDAALLLDVHQKTIQNYMTTGRLPGISVRHGLSSRFEFEIDDVLKFAASNGIIVNQSEYKRLVQLVQ